MAAQAAQRKSFALVSFDGSRGSQCGLQAIRVLSCNGGREVTAGWAMTRSSAARYRDPRVRIQELNDSVRPSLVGGVGRVNAQCPPRREAGGAEKVTQRHSTVGLESELAEARLEDLSQTSDGRPYLSNIVAA